MTAGTSGSSAPRHFTETQSSKTELPAGGRSIRTEAGRNAPLDQCSTINQRPEEQLQAAPFAVGNHTSPLSLKSLTPIPCLAAQRAWVGKLALSRSGNLYIEAQQSFTSLSWPGTLTDINVK